MIEKTHNLVASKQNLMPYKIHVLGPECVELKKELYVLTTSASSKEHTQTTTNYQVYAPYVFVFTNRLVDNPNEKVENAISKGYPFHNCFPETYQNENSLQTACVEIGMWSKIFTGLCLENNIDVSYLKCFNDNPNDWSFINEVPLFVMCAGYRQFSDSERHILETKPDLNDVVYFENG